ncbi:hypothetical protein LXT21_30825 [Myxococcus sp. K38C18041901]|uniref:hypothetical protein n=1 Tax=Myxococcus guangdongensis TaxID=2906760 RepID=UPI0020A79386|nr:hypothetical protein [Myxococcus guangdongensis]MCP3063179.1 hypothetical protein [Myxococcus guangdongensis]
MRGLYKGLLGLMAVLTLSACGGPAEEAVPETLGETEQALACRHPDDYCPGNSTCVGGLCRDCVRQPHWCQ